MADESDILVYFDNNLPVVYLKSRNDYCWDDKRVKQFIAY